MFYILITGIVMACLSAVFWCIEALPFVRAMKRLPRPRDSKNPMTIAIDSMRYIVGFISAVTKLWPLVIDIIVTVWLTGAFGFSGMIGGVIGVSISNVISVFLLIISRKKKI